MITTKMEEIPHSPFHFPSQCISDGSKQNNNRAALPCFLQIL